MPRYALDQDPEQAHPENRTLTLLRVGLARGAASSGASHGAGLELVELRLH